MLFQGVFFLNWLLTSHLKPESRQLFLHCWFGIWTFAFECAIASFNTHFTICVANKSQTFFIWWSGRTLHLVRFESCRKNDTAIWVIRLQNHLKLFAWHGRSKFLGKVCHPVAISQSRIELEIHAMLLCLHPGILFLHLGIARLVLQELFFFTIVIVWASSFLCKTSELYIRCWKIYRIGDWAVIRS